MSKKNNKETLAKREKLRIVLPIFATVIGALGICASIFNFGAVSSVVSLAFISSIVFTSGIVMTTISAIRAGHRAQSIKDNTRIGLQSYKELVDAVKNYDSSKKGELVGILKTAKRYYMANLKLCKAKGFTLFSGMKEMMSFKDPNLSSLAVESDIRNGIRNVNEYLGEREFLSKKPKGQTKAVKLSKLVEKRVRKTEGTASTLAEEYIEKVAVPDTTITVDGINRIKCNFSETCDRFKTIVSESELKDFGSLIRIDYNQRNLLPTCVHFSDDSKTKDVKDMLFDEIKASVAKYGEEVVFPIVVTTETELTKNKRLMNKNNIDTTRFENFSDFAKVYEYVSKKDDDSAEK